MRQEHGRHDCSWWKSEIITKWANNSWRFKMENAFGSAIFNSKKDEPFTWFLKQKDRGSALHPDMSDSMINMKKLRKCGGELEHAIKCRCKPYGIQNDPKISREDKKPFLKCHKGGSTSHLANTLIKKTKINGVQVIEDVQCAKEKEASDQDSEVSEDTPVEDLSIENIKPFFEVTEFHTPFPQYSEDFYNLIDIQNAGMCKTKPARGKGFTAGSSCITSIVMNDVEAKVSLDTGAFLTCIGKDYLQIILPEWKNHLSPIEGVQFSSASNNLYPLGILDTNIVFPHPAGSVIIKK
ncbi:hypothetical protein O181_045090 [Austropuccinia psidii MF-1]|uniref:Uncharacterized protein n=1 Tax=Austropuccinia psidii MF-1 TaxID=1389203 RepID=A0A9Q3HKU7_9BASI|nr:hypothetical protein [Austropuccinia psidii MF-1]